MAARWCPATRRGTLPYSCPPRTQPAMPLFEIDEHDELIPFRQLRGGAELYEREIEDLLWDNVEEFSGESLFHR